MHEIGLCEFRIPIDCIEQVINLIIHFGPEIACADLLHELPVTLGGALLEQLHMDIDDLGVQVELIADLQGLVLEGTVYQEALLPSPLRRQRFQVVDVLVVGQFFGVVHRHHRADHVQSLAVVHPHAADHLVDLVSTQQVRKVFRVGVRRELYHARDDVVQFGAVTCDCVQEGFVARIHMWHIVPINVVERDARLRVDISLSALPRILQDHRNLKHGADGPHLVVIDINISPGCPEAQGGSLGFLLEVLKSGGIHIVDDEGIELLLVEGQVELEQTRVEVGVVHAEQLLALDRYVVVDVAQLRIHVVHR